jgi:hypothetical protein
VGQLYFKNGQVKVTSWGVQFTLDWSGRQIDYHLSSLWKMVVAGVFISLSALTYWIFKRIRAARPLARAGHPEQF